MDWTRHSWTIFGTAPYEPDYSTTPQFNPPPRGILALTRASWSDTRWSVDIAGANGLPYIAWIGTLLRVPQLAAIVLSFLALPAPDTTFQIIDLE